jgi:hypothetical protein
MRWISHLNKKAPVQCRGTIAERATIAELICRICRVPAKALSREVAFGLREENALETRIKSPVLIQSEPECF